jgi:uncharacterized UBP type Zn finger protein
MTWILGIRNHGNTCFINAILQCLSYTDILAEYFVLDVYKGDLKRKKKLQTTLTTLYKRGTNGTGSNTSGIDFCGRGEVTEQLATLLKSLWSLQYDPEISVRFKSLVEKHASQYKGEIAYILFSFKIINRIVEWVQFKAWKFP